MTQRHPGVLSAPSLFSRDMLLFPAPLVASSSSMISAGFTLIWTTFGVVALKRQSFSCALSSSRRPKWMRRIAEGDDGFGSHSVGTCQQTRAEKFGGGVCVPSLQSRQISSLSVYTLMTKGSNVPPSPSAATPRLLRYFSSILYGCRVPVEVSNKLMMMTGPAVFAEAEVGSIGVGRSVEGPMASVSWRVRAGGGMARGGRDEAGDRDRASCAVCCTSVVEAEAEAAAAGTADSCSG